MWLVHRRPRSRRFFSGIAALLVAGLIVGATARESSEASLETPSPSARFSRPPVSPLGAGSLGRRCGSASAAMIAAVYTRVAQRIYTGELAGRQTGVDAARVRDSSALLSAMSAGNPAAIYAAVHSIVYKPHWHIVRLQAIKAGRIVADVGGPYVIAPVSGVLRQHGRKVGRYVMSVQDDVGYVKLVSRFIGVPVDLYRGRSFLMGTLRPAPQLPKPEATILASGRSYEARVFAANGFPAGALNVALLIPAPSRSLTSMSCQAVLAQAWGSVAMHIASRLTPLSAHYQDLVGVIRAATGGSAFVTSGTHQIAGGKMPRRLPTAGAIRLRGASRGVFSWLVAPGVRVYFVTPA
jgi:hypothetical protein